MQLEVPKSCPFKIEYNENLNLRDLGVTNYFKEYLRIGLYQRSCLGVVNGQLKENRNYGSNEQWGIYDQLVTIDKNSKSYGGVRNEFIEDMLFGEFKMAHKFADLSFRDVRWLCQDVINRGNIKPIPIQVISKKVLDSKNVEVIPSNELQCKVDGEIWWYSDDGKNLFKIHPGGNVVNACYFVGIGVQTLIFSLKDDEFDFGGDILTYGDMVDIFLVGKEYKKFKSSPYHHPNIETFSHLLKTLSKIGLPETERISRDGFWLHTSKMYDIAGYGAIFRNSFPLNVYIGVESKEEFDECCNRVIKVRDEIFKQSGTLHLFPDFFYDEKSYVFKSVDYVSNLYENNDYTPEEKVHARAILDQVRVGGWGEQKFELPCETKSAKINFIQISQSDYMNVPKYNNYKGFSAYLNSETDWERDIFDLFFLGNSKIAKSYLGNDLIFYNCEHPIWKYDIECHESDTIKIPSEFCKSIVGNS